MEREEIKSGEKLHIKQPRKQMHKIITQKARERNESEKKTCKRLKYTN